MRINPSAFLFQAQIWACFVVLAAGIAILTGDFSSAAWEWLAIAAVCAVMALMFGRGWKTAGDGAALRRKTRQRIDVSVFIYGLLAVGVALPWVPETGTASFATLMTPLVAVYSLVAGYCLLGRPASLAWLMGGEFVMMVVGLGIIGAHAQTTAMLLFAFHSLCALGLLNLLHRSKRAESEHLERNGKLAADCAEQGRRLDEAIGVKSRFLAAASHDLRQPVQALSLFVEELARLATVDQKKVVNRIKAVSDNLTSALNALADITKLDDQNLTPRRQTVDLRGLIERTCLTFGHIAEAKGIKLRHLLADVKVVGDPAILFTVIANLVSNAVKYTDDGSVEIFAVARGTQVDVTIRDSGRGIAERDRPHIYEEFFRGGNVGSTETGMGLGLAIVRRLAHLSDIAITMSSSIGVGTKFVMTLPLAIEALQPVQVNVMEAKRRPHDRADDDAFLYGRHVIVLENDPVVATSLREILASWGAAVTETHTSRELRHLVKALPVCPDLLIVDYHLEPGVTGFDAVEGVRGRQDCAPIPVLMMTGDLDVRVAKAAASLGIALMYKPLPPSRLKRTLLELLGMNDDDPNHPSEFAITWPGVLEGGELRH